MADKKNGYRAIAADISEKIEKGVYAPDSLLPAERELMASYAVERTTVRRALSLLEADGKIVKKPNVGTFVAPSSGIPAGEKAAESAGKADKPAEKKSGARVRGAGNAKANADKAGIPAEKAGDKAEKVEAKVEKAEGKTEKVEAKAEKVRVGAKKPVKRGKKAAGKPESTVKTAGKIEKVAETKVLSGKDGVRAAVADFDMTNARFLAAKEAFALAEKAGHERIAVVTADDEAFALLAGLAAAKGASVSDCAALCASEAMASRAFRALDANKRFGGFTLVMTATEAEAEAILADAPKGLKVLSLSVSKASRISGYVFDEAAVKDALGKEIGVAKAGAVKAVRLAVLPVYRKGETFGAPERTAAAPLFPTYLL